jgi:proline iminopeptidase
MNKAKSIALALAVGSALPMLLFLVLFIATWGEYTVPPTVLHDPNLPRIQLNQTTFHSESFGDPQNPLVLVLHDGPGGDYRSLLALKALADRYHVVFYDQRGSGLSLRVAPDELSIDKALEDLQAFVSHYGNGQPVSLVGHGWGGMLATAYTGQNPEQVQRLSLLEPGFLNSEMAALVLPAMSKTSAGFIAKTSKAWVASLHIHEPDASASEDYVFAQIRPKVFQHCGDSLPEDLSQRYWRAGFKAWKSITQSTFDERGQITLDFTQGLERFKQPVQIFASSCNHLMGRDFQARQKSLFQQAEMISVAQSGHDLLLDQPDFVLKQLRHYMQSGEAKIAS